MKIDPKKIKELLSIMKKNHILKMRYRIKDEEIELELPASEISAPITIHHPPQIAHPIRHEIQEKSETKPGKYITSPLVGSFYRKPSPDSKEFVNVGSTVGENDVVCIVEAMKVMNEIKAHVGGKIVEILVQDGDPVEFGTQLFRVE